MCVVRDTFASGDNRLCLCIDLVIIGISDSTEQKSVAHWENFAEALFNSSVSCLQ